MLAQARTEPQLDAIVLGRWDTAALTILDVSNNLINHTLISFSTSLLTLLSCTGNRMLSGAFDSFADYRQTNIPYWSFSPTGQRTYNLNFTFQSTQYGYVLLFSAVSLLSFGGVGKSMKFTPSVSHWTDQV
jgi:hypothetical protein